MVDASFLCRCWWWINLRITFVTVSSLTGGGREVKEKKVVEQLFIDFMGNLVGYQKFWQVYWMFADIRFEVNRDMSPSPWNITSIHKLLAALWSFFFLILCYTWKWTACVNFCNTPLWWHILEEMWIGMKNFRR